MSNNKEINIQAGPGVYRYFRDLDLDPWICLGEFVDNSVGSFLDKKNQKKLKKIYKKPHLEVTLIRNKKNNTIEIHDNACGIHNSEIDRALKIGERPDNRSGLNEFGVGMKMAAFWFSKKWTITSTAIGESFVKQVTFDVDEIEAKNLSSIESIEIGSASEDEHKTIIELQELYPEKWPRVGNTLKKIRDHLSSMYREFTKNGQLTLHWEDGLDFEKLTYKHPKILDMPFVDDMKGPSEEWKVEVDFEFNKKKINGWVGLLDKPGGTKSGFTLLRRGRVIEGQERVWKPDKTDSNDFVFFSGNSEPVARLFGELNFSGFAVSNSKSKIDWGPSGENIKEAFLEYLFYLIKRDKNTGDRNRFWIQTYGYTNFRKKEKEDAEATKRYKEDLLDQEGKLKSKYRQKILNFDPNKIKEKDFVIEDDLKDDLNDKTIEFPVKLSEEEKWNIKCKLKKKDGKTLFYFTEMPGDEYPRELTILIDLNHQFLRDKMDDFENFQIIFQPLMEIFSIICINEVLTKEENRQLYPADMRLQLNSILKE